MISPNLKTIMQSLLFQWFSVSGSSGAQGELNVQGFLSGVQDFDYNCVPVAAIWKLKDGITSQERRLSDFFHKDVAIVVYSDPDTITRQTTLLRKWLGYTKVACAVHLKDKMYYIGRGYLLDSHFKPLIMATYSVKEFQRNHLSNVFVHSPMLHIAPEVLVDPYWKKLVTECMIPVALESKAKLFVLNSQVPKKYANVTQHIDVRIHDLSQFVLPIEMPPLTMNISEELTTATSSLPELPETLY